MDVAITKMDHIAVTVKDIEGPVKRTGVCGPLGSFYFRDPSGNLIEIATEV
jgi:catechol 2,3-dioxygenase-like lactoylglutathione lyase family enzyme